MTTTKNPAAVQLGRSGGQVKSPAKTASSRENGRKGGRPKKPTPAEALAKVGAVLTITTA
jgi:hypothetical protein